MTDRLAELGALAYAAENTATASTSPNRLGGAGYLHAAYAEYQTWAAANPNTNPSRLSAKGRLFGYFYDNTSDPDAVIEALFAAGEQGAWYDPSDFSTMFQDSAGTTPVTAVEHPVGKILDKSGRGNHASQSTTTKRPILRQDAGGKYYLDFDGTDDSWATGSIDFSATDKMSIFAGVRKNTNVTMSVLEKSGDVELGGCLTSNDWWWLLSGTGGAVFMASPASYTPPITNVLTCLYDFAGAARADEIKPRIDGATPTFTGSGSATAGAKNFSNSAMYIGARAGTTFPFNGRIYSLIILGRTATADEITATEAWIANKTGVQL